MPLKSPRDLLFCFNRLAHYLRGILGIHSSVRMAYQKHKQHRLPGYDYAQPGAYFITICTQDREHFFGSVTKGKVQLSEIGVVTEEFLLKTSDTFENSTLDCWVIMPNHVHMILVIHPNRGYAPRRVPTGLSDTKITFSPGIRPLDKNSISSIINHFKGNVKRWCNKNQHEYFQWQSRFHDHIIRDESSLWRIRQYIRDNPRKWEEDRFFENS